jgi:hypothetical protein
MRKERGEPKMTAINAQNELLLKMKQIFKRFQPGGDLAPIGDRYEYEKGMQSLPPDERAFAEEATEMADMLQYCEQQNVAVPAEIAAGMQELRHLPIAERINRICELNRALIGHIFHASEDPAIRQ